MKSFILSVFCLVIFIGARAQDDSVFVYKNGVVVYSENVNNIDSISFRPPPPPLRDYDGNKYNTVYIGSQHWMAENLITTHLNDGTAIPLVSDDFNWQYNSTMAMSFIDIDTLEDVFGAYYKGFVVETGKLCPTGWHVPSLDDWQTLVDHLGSATAAEQMKVVDETYWGFPNFATNTSGFSAIGSGSRRLDGGYSWGNEAWYSSSTTAGAELLRGVRLQYDERDVGMVFLNYHEGYPVRCVQD